MKRFIVPVLCALTLSIAAPAMAFPQGKMSQGLEMRMERVMNNLKLTPEQRGQLTTLRARNQEQGKPIFEAAKAKQQELMTLMSATNANKDQAIAKQREINALHSQLAEMRINTWFEARKLLTPEQLKQLENLPRHKNRRR